MKLKAIDSYRELIILISVVIYLIIKRFPTPLIIMGTISLGICLYLMKYCINRLISKNEALKEKYKVKKDAFEENKTNRSSSAVDESKFKEEIRVLKKVIAYAESCSQYYNHKGAEAESFIDERCKPFIDLVTPILAIYPNEYQLVLKRLGKRQSKLGANIFLLPSPPCVSGGKHWSTIYSVIVLPKHIILRFKLD